MMLYQPRPLRPVDAIQWTGTNWDAIAEWWYGECIDPDDETGWDDGTRVILPDLTGVPVLSCITPDGEGWCRVDDWVIRSGARVWVMADDVFRAMYVVPR